MNDPLAEELATLHELTGFRKLNRWWAKAEILLGLFAVAVGIVSALVLARRSESEVSVLAWAAPILLMTLGGYLALAGHRSHLYQSNLRLTSYLAFRFRRSPTSD